MDKSYNIAIKRKSTEKTTHLSGQIPSKSWETLLRFRDEVKKLLSVLRECENLNVSFNLQWSRDDNVLRSNPKATVKDRDLAAILHSLRPFILQKETIEFNRTINTIQRHIRHEVIKSYFQSLKDLFSGKEFQGYVQVSQEQRVGELGNLEELQVVNSEKILMTWLNAYEYHRDDDKQKLIDQIDSVLPKDFTRMLFVSMVLDKVKVILQLGDIIHVIEEKGGFGIEIR